MKLRDKAKTKKGYWIDLPIVDKKCDCCIYIDSGTEGKDCGISGKSKEADKWEKIEEIDLGFELTKGVSLCIRGLKPSDVEEKK